MATRSAERELPAEAVSSDLYKLYVETAERVSDRRGSLNMWMLALVNAIVALDAGILGKPGPQADSVGGGMLVPAAGAVTCLVWLALLNAYRCLNAAKFRVIFDLEQSLGIDLFQREHGHSKALGRPALSKLERYVPFAFLGLFAAILIVRLAGLIAPA